MEQEPLRVGLIGYGTIGQGIARLANEYTDKLLLVGAVVKHPTHMHPAGSPLLSTLDELFALQPEVIVEVAGHDAVIEHGPAVLRAGIDLILVSIGALTRPGVLDTFREAVRQGNAHMKIVSGAIGGLDALAAASLGGLHSVLHTMRKPPHALLSPEDAAQLHSPCEIFRGNVLEAVHHFPNFLNVAAAVALAGKGFEQTTVCVVADPAVTHSQHEVAATGTFGTLRFEITNEPEILPTRGARLVAMSVVQTLLQRRASLIIG